MADLTSTVHGAIGDLLDAAGAAIEVDDRAVTIWRDDPDHTFKQAQLPLVIVEQPRLVSRETWDNRRMRTVFNLPLWFVDSFRPRREGLDETEARLKELRGLVLGYLETRPNLNLAWLGVLGGFWTWSVNDEVQEQLGNNLMRIGITLTIPVIAPNAEG